jgi:hypothetical protein
MRATLASACGLSNGAGLDDADVVANEIPISHFAGGWKISSWMSCHKSSVEFVESLQNGPAGGDVPRRAVTRSPAISRYKLSTNLAYGRSSGG